MIRQACQNTAIPLHSHLKRLMDDILSIVSWIIYYIIMDYSTAVFKHNLLAPTLLLESVSLVQVNVPHTNYSSILVYSTTFRKRSLVQVGLNVTHTLLILYVG
jgi:hypothetical protein